MKGTITGKDVVLHSASILRHWGVTAYLSCLWAALTRKQTTFLRVLYPVPAELGGRRPLRGRAP
jgi:hypothetical protein